MESSPKGQPSWQQKVDVITNKDLGRISKTVPTKSAVQKNLCKRRKTKVEPHESREKAKGEKGERRRWEAERKGQVWVLGCTRVSVSHL